MNPAVEIMRCGVASRKNEMTLDVENLSSPLQSAIWAEVGMGDPGPFPGLSAFVPPVLAPVPFVAGLGIGAAASAGLARGLSEVTDIDPLWYTGGAAALALLGHIVTGSSLTLGLFAGTVPLLIEQGAVALVDMILGDKEVVTPTITPEAPAAEGLRGVDLSQLTRRSVDELKRIMAKLGPRGGAAAAGVHHHREMNGAISSMDETVKAFAA